MSKFKKDIFLQCSSLPMTVLLDTNAKMLKKIYTLILMYVMTINQSENVQFQCVKIMCLLV